jgi:hypothetical protein
MRGLTAKRVLSSDLHIFSLWISFIQGENKLSRSSFTVVAEAVFGGAQRSDIVYAADAEEAGRHCPASLDTEAALVSFPSYLVDDSLD